MAEIFLTLNHMGGIHNASVTPDIKWLIQPWL